MRVDVVRKESVSTAERKLIRSTIQMTRALGEGHGDGGEGGGGGGG